MAILHAQSISSMPTELHGLVTTKARLEGVWSAMNVAKSFSQFPFPLALMQQLSQLPRISDTDYICRVWTQFDALAYVRYYLAIREATLQAV